MSGTMSGTMKTSAVLRRMTAGVALTGVFAMAGTAGAGTITNRVVDFGGKYGHGVAARRQTNATPDEPGRFTVPYADGGVGANAAPDWGDLLFDPTFPNATDPAYPIATRHMYGGYASTWFGSSALNLAYGSVLNGNLLDTATPTRFSVRYRGSLESTVTGTKVSAMLMFPKVGWLGPFTNRTVSVTGGDAIVSLYAMRNIYAACRLVVQDGARYYCSRKISKDTAYTTDGGNNPVPNTEVIVLATETNAVPDGAGGFSNIVVVTSARTNEWPGVFANLPSLGWTAFDPHASMDVDGGAAYAARTFADVQAIGVLWNGGVHYAGSTQNVAAAQAPFLMLNDFEFHVLRGAGSLVLVR